MYPLLFMQIVFWGYWIVRGLLLLLARIRKPKAPKQIDKAIQETKNPTVASGAKYYSVSWNLKTCEVVEEVGE